MRLIVSSTTDPASCNILKNLLELWDWDKISEWKGNPVYRRNEDIIASVNRHHIYVDDVDIEIENSFDVEIDHVVYISKHASEAGVHSLTVHPVGNFGKAKFGGLDNRLVLPIPHEMTAALRLLREMAQRHELTDEYEVSFEATHHGPHLKSPTYYIEIGSEERCWNDPIAGEAIARTVMEVRSRVNYEEPVVFCVGGGHYAPKFTDLVRYHPLSVGHIVPGWAVDQLDEDNFMKAAEQSNAEYVYTDSSSLSPEQARNVFRWANFMDLKRLNLEKF